MLTLDTPPPNATYQPLDTVKLNLASPGTLTLSDGEGRVYYRETTKRKSLRLKVGGALGTHTCVLTGDSGEELGRVSFKLRAETKLEDQGKRYQELFAMLHWTMVGWHGETGTTRYNGKLYNYFVRWLRDHVHTLKGMKYFYPELKTGIELFADSQREDGMIWDNVLPRDEHGSMWDERFRYGDFIRPFPEGDFELKRIPVENDVEFLFLEGLYYTWKATGDTAWMTGLLDNAIKAVKYATSDPYRWSKKFQLLKRGYTIDTWDFQCPEDAEISSGGDAMVVKLDKTRFGVMHGDNTGMAMGLRMLSEMLEVAGRQKEAKQYANLGKELQARLDKVSWNGKFFTHHVPEEDGLKRDLGVDESKQISLSNAYALNREISHEQAVAIIQSYQAIKKRLPHGSPGEWYQIYPIFTKNFGGHGGLWEYMNGGVTTIVAGELARGAFVHGFEEYGADILDRLSKLGKQFNGYFPCCLRGSMPKPPKRTFTTLGIEEVANADTHGKGAKGVPGWTGEGDNDFRNFPSGRKSFEEIPFALIDPAKNGRRAALILSNKPGYATHASVPVGTKAKALYLLHTMGRGQYAGRLTLRYTDGSTHAREILNGRDLGNWWIPSMKENNKTMPSCKVAWRGPNPRCSQVGCYVLGIDNPHPAKVIEAIEFDAAGDGAQWMVLGVTVSDHEVFFMPSKISAGIPDNWGAGAVVYAIVEGLAGVVDAGVNFNRAELSPRWPVAGVNKASVAIVYPAGNGYLAYEYKHDPKKRTQRIEWTGSGEQTRLRLLVPGRAQGKELTLDGEAVSFETEQIESSTYAVTEASGGYTHMAELTY